MGQNALPDEQRTARAGELHLQTRGQDNRSASFIDWIEFLACLSLFALFRALPLSWGLRLGAALGALACGVLRGPRRVGLRNLALAFPDWPESQRKRVLRASFENLGRALAEASHFDRWSLQELNERVQIADRALWQRLLAEHGKRGLVVLTAHFGNWELLAHFHGRIGHPITLIHRPLRNPLLERWLIDWRARAGTRSLPKRRAAREALRALREGAILAVPGDQNQVYSFGVFVNFFGIPACTSPGAVRLAQHAGVPVVPVFLRRVGGAARHVLEVLPPLQLESTGDRERDLVENTRRCAAVIEEMIRRYPEEWVWFHKRWKTRPPGEPKLYD